MAAAFVGSLSPRGLLSGVREGAWVLGLNQPHDLGCESLCHPRPLVSFSTNERHWLSRILKFLPP